MIKKKFFKSKNEVRLTFKVDRDDLDSVEWVSEINDWTPVAMKRSDDGKGPFKLKVRVPKNAEIQFRYRFDGRHWENDEAADAYWPNGTGSDNSVVFTSEP